jgi:hypothetical protein
MSDVATKTEIMEQLSAKLRNGKSMSDDTFVKVLTVYSKLSGWDKTQTPSPKKKGTP